MHLKHLTAVLAVSLLTLSPAMPIFGTHDSGAAYAKGEKGGGGGGGGKSEGKSEGKGGGKAETKAAISAKAGEAAKKAVVTKAKGKPVAEEGALRPNELGKMNGAMNANINAVLAHIRNGQITKGPVGLLAGLAIADAGSLAAAASAAELQELADSFDSLDAAVTEAGFASVEDYLLAKKDGTLTDDQLAFAGDLDTMIESLGGTTDDGLALAETKPLQEDILAAEEAAEATALDVAGAELAIGDAWNKDGDLQALLVALREKLAPYQAEIGAALAEPVPEDETAVLLPGEEPVLE